jgi:NADP-dependent 3-hydroxy acid dehydrogenase YdfG
VAAPLRQTNALDELKAQHGDRLWVASLDVTDTDAVRHVIALSTTWVASMSW